MKERQRGLFDFEKNKGIEKVFHDNSSLCFSSCAFFRIVCNGSDILTGHVPFLLRQTEKDNKSCSMIF